MKKRGIIVTISGVILLVIAISITASVTSNSQFGTEQNTSVAKMFDGMFDSVSEETLIQSGTSGFFTFTATKPNVHLFWGVQVLDFQEDDKFTVKISNIYGDSFGTFTQQGPMTFQMLQISSAETYNFQVENNGKRDINIIMMFTEDPENSSAFNNPDSPMSKIIIPILISGILFIIGIIIFMSGIVIMVYDWKNQKKKPFV